MYEIEQRELKARLYLGKFLCENGFDVLIFQHRLLSWIALFGKPGILFLKSNPRQFDYSISLLAKRGFRIYLWQEEGIHTKYNQFESPIFSTKSVVWIHKYLAWHPADADFAIRQGFDHGRVEICGNTRMELVSKISRRSRTPDSPLRLLVISNFDLSRITYNFLDDESLGTTAAQDAQDAFDLMKSVTPKNFRLYETLLNHPGILNFSVTYRPYFFEQKIISMPSQVFLDANLSVLDTLKNVDVVIHYGSTVGIESVQAGILSVNLSADLASIDPRIFGISMNFSDVDELLKRLQSFSENPEELESAVLTQAASCIDLYEMDFRRSNQSSLILEELISDTEFPMNDFIKYSRIKIVFLELRNIVGSSKRILLKKFVKRKAPLLTIKRILSENESLLLDSSLLKLKYFRRGVYFSK